MIQKRFEANALRIQLNRRSCLDLNDNECKAYRPPIADFPNYSSQVTHNADLMHLDIKLAGEHTMEDAQFDAELQLAHMHLDDPRVAYIGIPISARDNEYHEAFQTVLDEFQMIYDQDKTECDTGAPSNHRRILQPTALFNPYEDFFTTVFFYRYNGSTTDPPCFPVTWFVLLEPMIISTTQLRQLKRLLLTHVDGDCRPTSVHNTEQTVTRPIQEIGVYADTGEARTLMLCQDGDFTPDDA